MRDKNDLTMKWSNNDSGLTAKRSIWRVTNKLKIITQ